MHFYPAAWFKLVPPLCVIGVALWGRASVQSPGAEFQVLLESLPYLLCFLAVFMAYQFNRSRLLLAALGVAAFYWLVQNPLQLSLDEVVVARAYLGAGFALCLTTLLLLVAPERGVFTPTGGAVAAGFLVLLCVSYFAGPLLAEVNAGAAIYYAHWPAENVVLSRGVGLLAALVFATGVAVLALRHEESDAALTGAFLALIILLAQLHLPAVSVWLGSAAAICILWGVLRSSHAMAYRDELTGLPGRRALNERLKMLGRRYTIAMVDIDHFKRFNDTYGHDVGDEVLRLVASRIRRVPGGGTAYRYGGEEFCVVFPRRDLDECAQAMDDIREEIANYPMSLRDRMVRPKRSSEGRRQRGATKLRADEVRVTVSVGLAARRESSAGPEAVLKAADKKLYNAKRSGRNRVSA